MHDLITSSQGKYYLTAYVFPPYTETLYFLTQVNAHYLRLRLFQLLRFQVVLTGAEDCTQTTVYTLACH